MSSARLSLRSLWYTIAFLMMLTPIGILAAGTAWGEWSPAELARRPALIQGVPAGLQRLSSFWTAPFRGYAPSFVGSPFFGYLLSAMFGVGLLLMLTLLSSVLRRKPAGSVPSR
jgi:cobalt/nickel transport system permease protein